MPRSRDAPYLIGATRVPPLKPPQKHNIVKYLKTNLFMAVMLAGTPSLLSGKSIELSPLGVYESGIFDEGAAEIVAHDPATQRLFVVNAKDATVDVLDISNPASPGKFGSIDVSTFGGVANSVAARAGIIAIAVENSDKQQPGKVVFFDNQLKFLSAVTVGALPDMLTFTPNGRYVLVANEGEPNDDYTVDPEGSVSIIRIQGDIKKLKQSAVSTARFSSFNQASLDPSIRIFGPNASVAQDIEPEYITISHDSKTAYVTCQENNAIATVDIDSAKVTRLQGLGFKEHSLVEASTTIHRIDPSQLPSIGTTIAGQSIALGGFSGLHFEGTDAATGRLKFVAVTDRGPNAEPTGIRRPFLLPGFTPEIVRMELDQATGKVTITQRIPLQRAAGVPLTGLPNTALSANASQAYNDEVPVDLLGNTLPLDPLGGDFEGVVVDPADGSFWTVDEYRPAIYHFDANGVLIKRYVPVGTAAAAGQAPGTFGEEVLPAELAQRRQNRGFEAVAIDGGKIYAFVQSPLRNPTTLSNGTLNEMKNIRVVEFNPATHKTKQFIYTMDNPAGPARGSRPDKLGDAVSFGNGEFLVVERDDDSIFNVDDAAKIEKKIYRFNLAGATDITSFTGTVGSTGKTVDQLGTAELIANGIKPIAKMLHVDLNTAGYNQVEKVEGLAMIDPWTLAVINDNDFGVANIVVAADGSYTLGEGYNPEPVQLGLIDIRTHGLDASNKDKKINIRQWPVRGMYLPDAIASYKVGGKTYLVTANEGDTRAYDGFDEEERIGKLALDPARFPDAAVLQDERNLGVLLTSRTMGRNPQTGLYEELYSVGTRSFSIWTTDGVQVYDSGDDFEWIMAGAAPAHFNASNTNNTLENRSDDKGPEPEGVVIGKAYGDTYAFVGLERIGGVMVYNINNPASPVFVDYLNIRDFSADVKTSAAGDLGPEGLAFISAEDSPNGMPLLVIGNEISGSTRILQINRAD